MKSYKTYVLLSLFSAQFVKTLVFSPTWVDAAVLLVLGAVFGYSEFKNNEKRLDEFEKVIRGQLIEINNLKEKVGTINIAQQFRPGSLGFKQ